VNTAVLVAETPDKASTVKGLLSKHLEDFEVVSGYIDNSDNFIELQTGS
jgi:hypothetical protein